jgi:hypothetical protein
MKRGKTWQETENEWLWEGKRYWRIFRYQSIRNVTNAGRRENEHVNETTTDTTVKQRVLKLFSTDLLHAVWINKEAK